MKPYIAVLLSACLFSGAAFATEPAKVVTGGVGESSQKVVKQVEENYNLKLVFTGNAGMYLANVGVSIRDKQGLEVVRGMSDGPFLLAVLKPGTYTVEATAEGYNKQQRISVGKTLNTYQLAFPVKDNIEVSMAR